MDISEFLNYGKFIAYFKINKANKLKQAKLPSTFQLVQHSQHNENYTETRKTRTLIGNTETQAAAEYLQ